MSRDETERSREAAFSIRAGWVTMWLGAFSGCIMMLWSFGGPVTPPTGFTEYGELPRRLLRLAHIALFMLPIINILIGYSLDQMRLTIAWRRLCAIGGVIGLIGIPFGLTAGALIDIRLKYLAVLPAYALLAALSLMAIGTLRGPARSGQGKRQHEAGGAERW